MTPFHAETRGRNSAAAREATCIAGIAVRCGTSRISAAMINVARDVKPSVMRNNQPTFSQQYQFPASDQLVSVTDLQGTIRYCNPAFVSVSGFAREQLIGQPHNIVRHPDMPQGAFADMWQTLGSGNSWTALVKNRRQDGSYYWVRANVTPVIEGGVAIAYLSVRTRPTPNEIEMIAPVYAAMQAAERTNGVSAFTLRRGQLHRKGVPGWIKSARRPGLATRMTAAFALPILLGTLLQTIFAMPMATLAVTAVASAVLGVNLYNSIRNPLQRVLKTATRLAACDLTPGPLSKLRHPASTAHPADALVDQRNEHVISEITDIARALTQLRANLAAVVSDVSTQALSVRQAVREIAAGNTDLATRTERQAACLNRTTETVKALQGTHHVAEQHMQATAQSTREAAAQAENGQRVITLMASTMETVFASAQRISHITSLIDGIAFQTNLLALNAAVEAARAGEHGRSFAVVAGEVQLLARRCAEAAKEITSLTSRTIGDVRKGAEMAQEAGATMHAIVQTFARTVDVVALLTETGRQQTQHTQQVEAAVSELDNVTQQNVALVEQVAAGAAQQRELTLALTDAVDVFSYEGKTQQTANHAENNSMSQRHP